MTDAWGWSIKCFAWVGPRQMTANGLEFHAEVAEDQRGSFQRGALPELGPQEFWCRETYKAKEEAIFAARTDASRTLQGCDKHARTQAPLQKAATPSKPANKSSRSPSPLD